jgi:predicted DNA binding CopG/RHH family protein
VTGDERTEHREKAGRNDVPDDLEDLAAHYDSTDLSAEIKDAELDDSVKQDPMITTALRLPKSVLDQVRALASAQGVKTTAWMRQVVEQAVSGAPGSMSGVSRESVEVALSLLLRALATDPAQSAMTAAEAHHELRNFVRQVQLINEQRVGAAVHDEIQPLRELLQHRA